MGMRCATVGCVAGTIMVVVLAGCRQEDAEPVPVAPVVTPMPADEADDGLSAVDELMMEVDDLMAESRFNEAAVRLEQAMADPAFEGQGDMLFPVLIRGLLYAERHDEAREQVLAAAATSPELAFEGFRLILQAVPVDTPEGVAEALAWCDAVLDVAVIDELKNRVWISKVELLLKAGDQDLLVASAPAVQALNEEGAARVALRVSRFGVDEAVRPDVIAFLQAMAGDSRPGVAEAVVNGLIDVHLRDLSLAEAEALFRDQRAHVADQRSAGYAIRLLRGYDAAGDHEAVDRVMAYVIEQGDAWPRARDQAGATWVRLATQAGDPVAFMDRVEAFAETGAGTRALASAFSSGFYLAMQADDAELKQRVTAFNQAFLARDDLDDHTRQMLLTQQLDSAFYREDFHEALEILEAGIPNQDEAWHQDLIGKVSAHVALIENRYDDAIAAFHRHIESVKQWTEPMQNPETGRFVIKEMVLGFNERRIGDIYAGMPGRDHDAAEAYARARDWYTQALELLESGTPEHAEAQAALAGLDTK